MIRLVYPEVEQRIEYFSYNFNSKRCGFFIDSERVPKYFLETLFALLLDKIRWDDIDIHWFTLMRNDTFRLISKELRTEKFYSLHIVQFVIPESTILVKLMTQSYRSTCCFSFHIALICTFVIMSVLDRVSFRIRFVFKFLSGHLKHQKKQMQWKMSRSTT